MEHPTVREQLTYMIFPFVYGEDFNKVQGIDHFYEKKVKKSRVYDHIANLVSNEVDVKGKIGKAFSLHSNKRQAFGLPGKDQILQFNTKKDLFYLTIEEIDLYLFESQVGFVALKLSIHSKDTGDKPSIEEFIETTYHLKRFYYGHYTLSYGDQKISLENLIHKTTAKLHIQSFFEKEKRPHHSVMFTAVLLDEIDDSQKQELPKHLYELRKSFTGNYLPTKMDLDTENNRDVFQAFENSYWGVSLEALSNIAYLTGDEKTDRFFQNSFFDNLEQTYFYLYLLALQQKYALLQLSIEAGSLHEEISPLSVSEQSETINRFKEKVIRFIVRSNYKQSSYVTHHSDLYTMIRARLGIDELLEELHGELEALSAFMDIKEDREHRQKESRTNFIIQMITLIFLPITVISGLFGMNIPFTTTKATNEHFLLVSIICYFLAVLLFILFKEMNKDKK